MAETGPDLAVISDGLLLNLKVLLTQHYIKSGHTEVIEGSDIRYI
jgi:hypothetical protein